MTGLQPAPRPTIRAMLTRPHQWIALVCGIGTLPVWPGTVGTAAGFGLFLAMQPLPLAAKAAAYVALLAAGSWAVNRTGQDLQEADHNGIVVDETIAMSLTLELIAPSMASWVIAFLFFRLFDVAKPWPIHLAHRTGRGGFMVILDDLLAAIYAAAATILVCAFFA